MPYGPVKYTPKVKAALVFDLILVTALLVVGTLAIVGSGMPADHMLHSLGAIGTAGGGVMIAGGILVGLIDTCFHKFCTGFETWDPY